MATCSERTAGRHHHPSGRRNRERGERVAARWWRRGRCDSSRRGAGAAARMPADRRMPDRRCEAHQRLPPSGEVRHPYGGTGVARRHAGRAGTAGVVLSAFARTGGFARRGFDRAAEHQYQVFTVIRSIARQKSRCPPCGAQRSRARPSPKSSSAVFRGRSERVPAAARGVNGGAAQFAG